VSRRVGPERVDDRLGNWRDRALDGVFVTGDADGICWFGLKVWMIFLILNPGQREPPVSGSAQEMSRMPLTRFW